MNQLVVIPIAFAVLAVIFSPIGISLNPQCSVNPLQQSCIGQAESIINNPNCQTDYINNANCAASVQFLTNASIAFTPQGYSYIAAAQKQQCESVTLNGATITQTPVLGTLSQLPVLGNIVDFFVGLGQWMQSAVMANFNQNQNNILTNTNSIPNPASTAQNCLAAATSIILNVSFQGSDIILLFVGAVLTAAAIAALSSIVLNAGGAIIIFKATALGLIFLVLTALGYATWATIPAPFGSFIYLIVTLVFALGIISDVSTVLA